MKAYVAMLRLLSLHHKMTWPGAQNPAPDLNVLIFLAKDFGSLALPKLHTRLIGK